MWKIPIGFLCLIALVLPASGQNAQDVTGEIDELMNEFVRLEQFAGCVLVAKDGKRLYAKSFGEADRDHHVKNSLKTKFNIGSIGKVFTGVAIMQLAEAGKIEVTDPASKYLKDFPWGDEIQIHHLLSHTSGTFNYFAHPDFRKKMFSIRSVGDALPLIYDQKLRFDSPGTDFSYSNSGIVLLGAIIESVTGQSYPAYIQEQIFKPVGMEETAINYLEEVVEDRARGYTRSPTGRFTSNLFTVPPANADGGIETTVGDLLKFDQALYGEDLLGSEWKRRMFTPNLKDYGYCWRIERSHGNLVVGHGGGAPGVSASFKRFTDDRYTIIVLSNYTGGAGGVARAVEAILFGDEYELPKPRLGAFLYQTMEEKGLPYVVENFDPLLSENGYSIRSSWNLVMLGYGLLEEEKVEMAIEIFRQSVRLFPDEANPYDSLGDAYVQKGDIASAIDAYKRALDRDPEFESAKRKLEELQKK
jgi:CubicO group peptidase (beta-lactamase class C family)